MVSCVDFIPLYNEMFKYIENENGHDAVVRFWLYVSDNYVAPTLEPKLADKGLEGAWEHWTQIMEEEACDCHREYDTDKQVISSHMRYCPSKGHLLEMKHIEPYWDYCGHCQVLYARILEKYGITYTHDNFGVDHAECRSGMYFTENGIEGVK